MGHRRSSRVTGLVVLPLGSIPCLVDRKHDRDLGVRSVDVVDRQLYYFPPCTAGRSCSATSKARRQEDVARELGWSKGTASGNLVRAKNLLRARLTRRGFVPVPALPGLILAEDTVRAAVPASLVDGAVRSALGAILGREEALAASSTVMALGRGRATGHAPGEGETDGSCAARAGHIRYDLGTSSVATPVSRANLRHYRSRPAQLL
jgi:hypothetical protein